MKSKQPDRRALLSGLGVAAAAVALGPSSVRAQTRTAFTPARHEKDDWLDQLPGKHRVFIDSTSAAGASAAMLYALNLFSASKSGYGLEDSDLALVICFRHFSTAFGFNSDMWAKYGKALADDASYVSKTSSDPPTANPYAGRVGGSGGILGLSSRGAHFAICDVASHAIASRIARAAGTKADDVYQELAANIVPNGHFVAAGVIGATRAQEYGYSLLVGG